MTPTVRVYPFAVAPAAEAMAADEVLLDHAAAGAAALRFYGWAEPTLSLGYFQPAAERLPDLPWVRRASGGAAILHGDGDLTYALALPAGRPWQDGEPWVCRFHRLIRDELVARGADAKLVVCGEEAKLGPALCFLDHTAGDVRLGGVKVAGSAQRKLRGAVLQHGTLRLTTSRRVPGLPGVRELAGVNLPADEWVRVLSDRFAAATGWRLAPADWTPADHARIVEIASTRYGSPEWNEKR